MVTSSPRRSCGAQRVVEIRRVDAEPADHLRVQGPVACKGLVELDRQSTRRAVHAREKARVDLGGLDILEREARNEEQVVLERVEPTARWGVATLPVAGILALHPGRSGQGHGYRCDPSY